MVVFAALPFPFASFPLLSPCTSFFSFRRQQHQYTQTLSPALSASTPLSLFYPRPVVSFSVLFFLSFSVLASLVSFSVRLTRPRRRLLSVVLARALRLQVDLDWTSSRSSRSLLLPHSSHATSTTPPAFTTCTADLSPLPPPSFSSSLPSQQTKWPLTTRPSRASRPLPNSSTARNSGSLLSTLGECSRLSLLAPGWRTDAGRRPRVRVRGSSRENGGNGDYGWACEAEQQQEYSSAAKRYNLRTSLTSSSPPPHLLIAFSWNDQVITPLIAGTVEKLLSYNVKRENIVIETVPGSYELPMACSRCVFLFSPFLSLLPPPLLLFRRTTTTDHAYRTQAHRRLADPSLRQRFRPDGRLFPPRLPYHFRPRRRFLLLLSAQRSLRRRDRRRSPHQRLDATLRVHLRRRLSGPDEGSTRHGRARHLWCFELQHG